jgi:hypothetical protein
MIQSTSRARRSFVGIASPQEGDDACNFIFFVVKLLVEVAAGVTRTPSDCHGSLAAMGRVHRTHQRLKRLATTATGIC